MSICENKINDFQCEVPRKKKGFTNFKGSHLYPIPYFNGVFLAKRGSGKTVCLYNAVKELMRQETHIILVSSTVDAPDNYYVDLQKILKKNKQNYSKYDSVFQGKGNIFKMFIDHMKNKTPIPPNVVFNKKKLKKNERKINNGGSIDDPICKMMLGKKGKKKITKEQEEKKKTNKYTLPYIFVLDDLSEPELRCSDLDQFIRMCRHFRCVMMIATQDTCNLPKKSRNQYDYLHIYKNMDDDRLELIYKLFQNNCSISEEMFYNIYHYICDGDNYNFMLMDRNGKIRKNYNTEIKF